MGKIFFALGSIAIIAFVLMIGPGMQERQANHNEYLRRKQAQDLYSRDLDLQRKEALQGVNIMVAGAGMILMVMSGAAGAAIMLYWSAGRAYHTRVPLVKTDAMGRLPVSRLALTEGVHDQITHRVMELLATAQVEKAIHQPGQTPASLSYSGKVIDMPTVETPQVIEQPKEIPEAPKPRQGETLIQCYRRNGIIDRSGDSLHIGHNVETGTPVYLELELWGSKAIGGVSRTGKSNRVAYYACQGALMGLRMTICDPDGPDSNGNGGKKDSLLKKLQPLVDAGITLRTAVEPAEIVKSIDLTYALLETRQKGGGGNWHHLLLIDEFTNLVVGGHIPDKTLDKLAVLSLRGAGYGLHTLVVGHDWAAAASGNSKRGGLLKRIMTQRCSHRMSADGARILAPGNREAQQLITDLPDYRGVYIDAAGVSVVDTPYMTVEDIEYAARSGGTWKSRKQQTIIEDDDALLSGLFNETPEKNRYQNTTSVDNDETDVVISPDGDVSTEDRSFHVSVTPAEALKIAQLLQTFSPSEVAKKLDGYNSRNYKEYRAKVDLVVEMQASN